ncbi:MAG: type VI secretion system accessory protein TagJ [Burkholderiales bacterium]
MQASAAQQALRQGAPAEALKLLQDQVRAAPQDAKLRVFLFQLLCVLGQWDRALNQLTVAGELDASTLSMVQTYRETIQCERLRADVFAGKRVPMLFGEPQPWLALMIEALLREGRGEPADARRLRTQALDEAPATSGSADGKAFEWIADADSRLGPVLESIVNGRYYWVPVSRLTRVEIEAPTDLRDCVWMPAHFQFSNGGEVVGFIPTRYAGSEAGEPAQALARRTDWLEAGPGQYTGLGQRMLSTDTDDLPLMDVRVLELDGTDV